ncbi:protein of unknown function [Candidatus Nitrosocosmicus franklandus]|uniref:Uncharacterized protein n=1 Tax=Candidatus Nitrosocosmicus franklandianus TaxID=1798806 RepID=A0A484I9R0_9ARCH|nr:protein of unknown function [Candidatus Nitrosocosmicus franklandus]
MIAEAYIISYINKNINKTNILVQSSLFEQYLTIVLISIC